MENYKEKRQEIFFQEIGYTNLSDISNEISKMHKHRHKSYKDKQDKPYYYKRNLENIEIANQIITTLIHVGNLEKPDTMVGIIGTLIKEG